MRGADSRAAHRLLADKERILEVWGARVRQEIPAMAEQPEPVLINTLPRLLHYLAEALAADHPRQDATDGSSIAQEHGGERVRVVRYRLEDIVREYQLLREVLLDLLDRPVPLTADERRTIIRSIDRAIGESCNAYVIVTERLREKFMFTLAHDLRGPLTAARAGAAMIHRRPGADEVPRWAARVVDSIDRVDARIRDLLDVGRAGAGRRLQLSLAPCELVSVAREVIEHLELSHGQRFVLAARSPAIHGHLDAEAVRRALENLLVNAVKYGSARPVTLTLAASHGRAQVLVHNEGSYIPPEERELLFEAFRRAASAERGEERGWGLGLALVRAVAEAHGGSIEVSSTQELGTTFHIDFPLDARPFQDRPTLE